MNAEEEAARKTNDTIRRTYDQLITTRNAQLRYMSSLKQKNRKEFAYILTPDLILQYNYVHQLMKSFHGGMPPDICVEDGGITCSNLSMLQHEQVSGGRLNSFPATLPISDGSDYLASRIVDLLDRPVTIGDQDLTLNVRDDFAANIKTLNLLFEERYRLCQEQGEKLKQELTTAKQKLAASRSASLEAATRSTVDPNVQRMQEQITRYEIQLRVVREQMEALQEMNDNAIARNQRELESLIQRFSPSERNESSNAFLQILQRMFEVMDSERDRVLATIQQIRVTNEQRSQELSQLVSSRRNVDSERLYDNRSVEIEIETRVEKEVAARTQDIERRVEEQVNQRTSAIEHELRAHMGEELKRQTASLQSGFDTAVADKVAQALHTPSIQVISHDVHSATRISTGTDQLKSVIENDTDLTKYKSVLDKIMNLKESVTNIVPLLPQYDLPKVTSPASKDHQLMKTFYDYLLYILNKLGEMYMFSVLQAGYLTNLAKSAYDRNMTLNEMSRERSESFTNQVNKMMTEHRLKMNANEKSVLLLLNSILNELPTLQEGFELFYKSSAFYQINEHTIMAKDDEIKELKDKLRSRNSSGSEKFEMERLRVDIRVLNTEVRELRLALKSKTTPKTPFDQHQPVDHSVAQADLRREKSFRHVQKIEFRNIYNTLADFVIQFGNEYKKWFYESNSKRNEVPRMLEKLTPTLNAILEDADRGINHGNSPRMDEDHNAVELPTTGFSSETAGKKRSRKHR